MFLFVVVFCCAVEAGAGALCYLLSVPVSVFILFLVEFEFPRCSNASVCCLWFFLCVGHTKKAERGTRGAWEGFYVYMSPPSSLLLLLLLRIFIFDIDIWPESVCVVVL